MGHLNSYTIIIQKKILKISKIVFCKASKPIKISAGLKTVLIQTEKLCIVSYYYKQFSINDEIKAFKLYYPQKAVIIRWDK